MTPTPAKTALVLSAGGLFGAYQVGAWKVLADVLQPDIVIGASIGSLNGWAIAGGCPPQELERFWLTADPGIASRLRLPRSLLEGFTDTTRLQETVRALHARYTPRLEYAVVLTDLLKLRPRLFLGPEVTWRHLVASCALLGILDQYRIGGRIYSDGGLLGALPLWAAVDLGATRIVAIHAMPRMPSAIVRTLVSGLRKAARFRPVTPSSIPILRIQPPGALGSARDMVRWRRDKIERWIALGEADARRIVASGLFGK